MCNVQDCANAVAGRWVAGGTIKLHLSLHKSSGHFAGSELPEPIKIVPGDDGWDDASRRHRGDYCLESQNSISSRIDFIDADNLGENDPMDIEPEDVGFALTSAVFDLEDTEKQAASIRERNDKLIESEYY